VKGIFGKLLAAGAVLILLYTAVGFLLFPLLINKVAARELTKALGRNVTIRKIAFNPYALSITVRGFQIDELKGGRFLSWETFYADFELWSSLFHRTWVFKEGDLIEPHVNVVRNADNTLNFADLLLLDWPKIPPFRLNLMRLAGGKVVFHDAALPSRFSTTIGPLTGNFRDFSMNPEHNNQYSFTAVSEAGEKFSWKGSFRLDPLSSHGELLAEDIQIKKYYPYFEEFLAFTITEGTLTARATYELDLSRDRFKAILTDGSVSAHSLKVSEHESDAPLFGLSEFSVSGARVDFARQRFDVATIDIVGGTAVVRRLPDGSLNVQHAVKNEAAPSVAKTPTSANWRVSVGEISLVDFSAEVNRVFGRETLKWKELRVSNPTFQMRPPVASMSGVTLRDGKMTFTDPSLTPPVRVALTHLDIGIGALSSDSPRGAVVAVHAKIDDIARLQISGETNPVHKRGISNVRGLLQNVNLVPLSPYVAKYLGYELEKGGLSLDATYLVQRRKLQARNRIELDHLTLGKRTESKDATTLPIHLAIALLRDSSGKITLNVPIEGTLGDPKFQFGKVFVDALFSPFTKVASSPFAALGAPFGGGAEELGYQEFSPGSAQLAPQETGKLKTIVQGLKRWPELMLDIEGSVDADRDTGDLQSLAANRAKAVKEYLLHHGALDPDRIFLIDNPPENVPRQGSRALLHLK
jgi:hypothetical protein